MVGLTTLPISSAPPAAVTAIRSATVVDPSARSESIGPGIRPVAICVASAPPAPIAVVALGTGWSYRAAHESDGCENNRSYHDSELLHRRPPFRPALSPGRQRPTAAVVSAGERTIKLL